MEFKDGQTISCTEWSVANQSQVHSDVLWAQTWFTIVIIANHTTGTFVKAEKHKHRCAYLHHSDPYLRLGPFKIEILLASPFRSIFHDILTEKEMDYLIDYSSPRLSNARHVPASNQKKDDIKRGKISRTVAKTNQASFATLTFHLFKASNI